MVVKGKNIPLIATDLCRYNFRYFTDKRFHSSVHLLDPCNQRLNYHDNSAYVSYDSF